ncbi:replicative DNA helicase [Streptomyces collinus]|uniref:replicative DNA helicase n=1 Tax=Streptomyces collinus TaxID=42684 RepID=UPI00369BDC11
MSVPVQAMPQQDEMPGASRTRRQPYDEHAEKALLAAMMFSSEAVGECQDLVRADDYYLRQHETIHHALVDRFTKGKPSDFRLLIEDLRQTGQLKAAGGASYITEISLCLETTGVGPWYAQSVHRKAVLRRLIAAGMHITEMGFAEEGEIDELMAEAAGEIATVAEGAANADDHDFVAPADVMADVLDSIDAAGRKEGLAGLATGYTDLDNLTNGLMPGQLIVIAGRPGMGKSTVAMDIARKNAIQAQVPTAFISLEMPVRELIMRCISAEGRIALHHLRSGQLTDDDVSRMQKAVPRINDAPLYINDCERTYTAVQAKLRRLKSKHPDLGLVVIDYIQLLKLGGRRPESRQLEVSEISSSMKLLAKELGVPIIALAQLNRGPEMRSDKKPQVSDLRESGSIEQDADMVILIHREDAYEKDSPRAGEADLIVGKHRNGSTAVITAAAQLHYSRFVDMAQT